ncbi:hypothetical protein T05_3675 [Trichinella murrelli]|uniref:Uncharacterized protein n=1 Tax=Trichinella murrelli TaxID=144512 RepID=A0A0V0U6Q1_9BILA|nr:hypothetical protein T05_3675 [Trichinella murrelli]
MNLNQVTSAQQWFTFDPSTEEWIYYIERLECEISVFSLLNGDGTEAACRTLLLSKLGQQHFCMLVDHFKPRTVQTVSYDELKAAIGANSAKKRIRRTIRQCFSWACWEVRLW